MMNEEQKVPKQLSKKHPRHNWLITKSNDRDRFTLLIGYGQILFSLLFKKRFG